MNYGNPGSKAPTDRDPLGIRENEIPARINAADQEIERLHNTIDKLASRLEGVMQPPSPDGRDEAAAPSLTHFGGRLMTVCNRARCASERLDDILNRLEV